MTTRRGLRGFPERYNLRMERVLITGARGRIGTVLRPALRSGLDRTAAVGPDRSRRPGRARDLVPSGSGGLRRGPRGRRGRRRGRAPRRGAGRGAVRDDRRPEPARHLPRLRGVPARGRARASCSRAPTTRPACTRSASRSTATVDAATGRALRRDEGLRRGARAHVRRPLRAVASSACGSARSSRRPRRGARARRRGSRHADGVRLVQAALTAPTSTSRSSTARRRTRAAGGRPTRRSASRRCDDAEVFADGLPASRLRRARAARTRRAIMAAGRRDLRRRAARSLRRAGRARDRDRGGALPARRRDARPAAARARGASSASTDDPRFKLELPASQLEIVTPPCAGRGDGRRGAAQRAPRPRDGRGADRPADDRRRAPDRAPSSASLTDDPRYQRTLDEYGERARRQLVSGLHLHVSLGRRGPHARRLQRVALAPAGARRAGRQRAVPRRPRHRARPRSARRSRSTCSARACRRRSRAGSGSRRRCSGARPSDTVPDARRWWFELRLHATYGTLELRAPDAQSSVDDVHGVAVVRVRADAVAGRALRRGRGAAGARLVADRREPLGGDARRRRGHARRPRDRRARADARAAALARSTDAAPDDRAR